MQPKWIAAALFAAGLASLLIGGGLPHRGWPDVHADVTAPMSPRTGSLFDKRQADGL
jgi:hypothetical protein